MNSLKKISLDLKTAEDTISSYIRALKENAFKWDSIRNSFLNYSNFMDEFTNDLPNLQSRLEANQAAVCDTIMAEIGKELVMFEHTIINCRGALAKSNQTLFTKPVNDAWEFPPTSSQFITESIQSASLAIEEASLSLEKKRMELYFLTSDKSLVEPSTIIKFCNSVL